MHALARQLLGSAYSNGVLELNASDSRGIDVSLEVDIIFVRESLPLTTPSTNSCFRQVVRNKIKGFAMNKVNLPVGR